METLIIDNLRWQERPSRVLVTAGGNDNGRPEAAFQAAAPRDLEALCMGRPVEELPRILPILSPAHHVVSARALDRLFGVEPPPMAENMRRGFLEATRFIRHLRKFYALLTAFEDPLRSFFASQRGGAKPSRYHRRMTDVMHHLGLAQEAAAILGGRSDHPLSAVAGGVSRFLKEGWYQRLEEIAAACKAFAPEWAAFFREELLREEFLYETAGGAEIPALDGLTLDEMDGGAALNAGSENEIKIPLEELEEQIAVKTESWSRDGFAYRADRGWQGVDPRRAESFFCVGPPARWKARAAAVSEFPSGEAVASEGTAAPADDTLSQLSMTEYRRMKEIVAPAKPFSIPAVYAALAVELVEAAERMEELFAEEKLVGAVPRRIPQGLERRETRAALEAPEGFIYHRYRVNRRGIVEEVRVLDADTENNALRCFIADSLVRAAAEKGLSEADRKRLLEIGLAPIG